MKIKLFLLLFLLAHFLPFAATAQDPCGSVKTAQDILDCAINHHPDVQISEASLKRDEILKKIAKQVPNPELESSILSGQPGAPEGVFVDVGLMQTIELGGKRKNRIKQAIATGTLTQAQLLESKELTALNTVLALYRLRQIRFELAAVSEVTTTYQHILKNYTSRPKLAPEQEVSSSVFDLAFDEAKLKKATLLQEQGSLVQFLILATGLSEKQILLHLPGSKGNWPKFVLDSQETNLNSEIAKANADKAIAEANLKLSKSNAWPDFKVGPSFQTQTGVTGQQSSAGINVGFSLPILSQNRAGIEYAKKDYAKSLLSQKLVTDKNQNERVKQIQRYQQALKSLHQIKSGAFINAKHENLEKFFDEGLISSSLVIETHRQMIDVTESRNIQELTALDALWRLYILEGKLTESKL
jgi:cobalt-zinc-cadmium efflux system outer membrane protein